jgi:DNA-directed RNA polymerase beta' subunit/intein/homing endonuclease
MSIYKDFSYTDQDIEIEKVKGVQFSVLGPDEIIKRSVVEITKTDTYTGNVPVTGGLFDPRLGCIDHGKLCATCEQKNIQCPGHFGHIVLAKPVYHVMFFDIVRKILKCVCMKCSKVMISKKTLVSPYKDDIAKIQNIKNNQKRWDMYFKMCNNNTKIKACGDDCEGKYGCGYEFPAKYAKDGSMKIKAEWKEEGEKVTLELTPEDVLKVFKRISEEDMELMGFDPRWNRPEWMICTVLPVPPPAVRPSIIEENGQRREDDLTHKLSDIVKTNNIIYEKIKKNASDENIKLIAMVLQYHVFTFINNQVPGIPPSQQRNGRKLKSVCDRMTKKDGRIRGNLNGKRVDQSARSVITPDPYISIDELGVPVKIAMNLSFPEIVNEYNIESMREMVLNGVDTWPGAKFVKKLKEGITVNIKHGDKKKIAEGLKYGDTVHRHMIDNDCILFNRQPSLHKMSMMCHKVKIMPHQTFRLNVLDTPPYNADFDGDEMNLHQPQNIQTMQELKDLASIQYMIVSSKNGKPIIEVVQDSLLGIFRLTKDHTRIDDKTMANLQMVNTYFNGAMKMGNLKEYNGKDAFSQMLPPGFFLESKNKSGEKVKIEDGILKSGFLDKNVFHNISNGLITVINHDYSPYEVRRFLNNTQRLVCRWLLNAGFSVGLSDLVMEDKTHKEIKKTIKDMKEKAYAKLDDIRRGNFENNSIFNNEEFVERDIINILNETNGKVSKIGLSQINERDNRMINMVKSGSKGKDNNVAQMIGCVGQQNVDGKRISYGFTGRTLPHYTKYDDGPEARGFVENSFINGLTPQEVFFHAMGGREGLIDTAVKSVTWETPIIIMENGETKYVKIGEWIDSYLDDKKNKENIEIFPEEANMELLKFKHPVMIPTCNEKGVVTWGELTQITRHDPGEVLYEVKTIGGRHAIVTASKGLLVWKNGEFVPTPSPEVKVGDYMPVTMNMAEPPEIVDYIDMSKYFPKTEYIFGSELHKAVKLYCKDAHSITGKVKSDWWEKNNGISFTLPYPILSRFVRAAISGRSSIDNIKEGCIYPYGASRQNSHFPEKFELNKENGIMIGLYLADGCTCIQSGTVLITKKEEGVKSFVKQWFDKYDIKHKEKHRETERGSITTIEGYSRYFGLFFNEILGVGSKDKHIPDVAYNAPQEFVLGMLNGYFSGDGSVGENAISASSISKNLVNGIVYLCSRIGVFAKTRWHQTLTNNLGTVNIAPTNTIDIRSLWARIFKEKIQLINKDKNKKLQNISTSKNHCNFPYINDVVKDQIKEINIIPNEIVKEKYPKMYDVTVPSTLNFMQGDGLVGRDTSDTG